MLFNLDGLIKLASVFNRMLNPLIMKVVSSIQLLPWQELKIVLVLTVCTFLPDSVSTSCSVGRGILQQDW